MLYSLPNFENTHVLVIGDVMLDRYWYGGTSRISPEAPVPVVHIQQQEERAGGAGNVALNIAALGAKATLLGIVGQDEAGQSIQHRLISAGVNCAFHYTSDFPTITKLRILSRHQQLLRLDFEENFKPIESRFIERILSEYLKQVDIVILSDYGKGTLSNPAALIETVRNAGKAVLIDPKGSDFSKYANATMITPNRTEFEAVVGRCESEEELVAKGEQLRQQLNLDALLITRSEQGMTLICAEHEALHLPAHAREVYDVTGAGDTVIGVLAAALAASQSLAQATALANVAAGLVVAKLGAATVSPDELGDALHLHGTGLQHSLKSLQSAVKAAQARGEVVVMTNGCFDILHAGHVQYLLQARQLGDRLIVAVNDDDSVRRLKGDSRPINSLEDRMKILSALGCVDWVIPFGEDTPRDLICSLQPNILVKGGDYQPEDIAGSDCVWAAGGKVLTLPFVEGRSTTRIIQEIQKQ